MVDNHLELMTRAMNENVSTTLEVILLIHCCFFQNSHLARREKEVQMETMMQYLALR